MIRAERRPHPSAPLVTSLVIAPLALLAAWASIAFSGTKFGVALTLASVLGPLALYAALTAPLIFPFALFVLVVPFDNLLAFSSFGTLTKLLGLASGAAIAVRLVRTRRYVPPAPAVLAWLPFLVLVVASFMWARDPSAGVAEASTLVELYLLYAVASLYPIGPRTLGAVVAALLLGGAVAGSYGAYLFHKGVDVMDGRLLIGSGGTGSMIDPNHFAAAMLLPFALALAIVLETRAVTTRIAAAATLALIGIGIEVSGSRGAFVALVAIFAYLLIRSRRRAALAAILLGCTAVTLAAFGDITARFGQAAETGGAGRLGIWRVGLAAFQSHPLLGAGVGNFPIAYNDAFLSVPAFASMKIIEGAKWSVAPHNTLVWVAVELGGLGLCAFVYACWRQFRLLDDVALDGAYGTLRRGIEAATIGLFVASTFLGTMTYKYFWLVFILAALVRNASLIARRPTR